MTTPSDLESRFWRLLGRVLECELAPGRYRREDLPQWDSLRHVELVFAIEQHFGVEVPAPRIAELYSDTDTVLAFLRESAGA